MIKIWWRIRIEWIETWEQLSMISWIWNFAFSFSFGLFLGLFVFKFYTKNQFVYKNFVHKKKKKIERKINFNLLFSAASSLCLLIQRNKVLMMEL